MVKTESMTLKMILPRIGAGILLALVFICGETGCSHAQSNQKQAEAFREEKTFTLPDIPYVLTSYEDRAAYLVEHFWENYDFSDTTQIAKPEIVEQIFVDFLDVLSYVPIAKGQKAMTGLMRSASVDKGMFLHFMKLTEKYLYDPNSPFRNEDFYIPVLNAIVSSSQLEETYKVRPRFQLKMALKNRPGSIAKDFVYTLSTGTSYKMSSIKADYIILFFNNPDCHDCKRAKNYIKDSPIFNYFTKEHAVPYLSVLAIYPDADIPLWRRGDYPSMMINSYDAGQVIYNKELYDLKAIPTFYLLDKDKRVIMKDAPIEQIESWLQMLINN